MPNRFRDIDRGYERITDLLRKLDGRITVGIHAEDNKPYVRGQSDAATLAQIATFHEFGAPKANLPQRSFMRSTLDEKKRAYFSIAESLLGRAIDGDLRPIQAMSLLGQRIKDDIRQKIIDIQSPPLTASTIAAKRRGYGRVQNADVEPGEPIRAPSSGPSTSTPHGADTGNPLVDTGQMKNAVDFQVDFPRLEGAVA